MKSQVVAILETRNGAHLGELVSRRGGIPLLAPALAEVPAIEPGVVPALLARWRAAPFRMVIFQTGVGTRALFAAAEAADALTELLTLLAGSRVVVRGPKPAGELNARQVRIDIRAPSPFTTETLLRAIAPVELDQGSVLIQQYGAANQPLREALEARGARVEEIATYRWALPADIRPLEELLRALAEGRVDAVVFTSAVQLHNLLTVAAGVGSADLLAGQLERLVVASIGPVCTRALRAQGIEPTFEADPPKLGPLMAGLEAALRVRAAPTAHRHDG